jgi:hypothetical protein
VPEEETGNAGNGLVCHARQAHAGMRKDSRLSVNGQRWRYVCHSSPFDSSISVKSFGGDA